jgi:hypothetical protein
MAMLVCCIILCRRSPAIYAFPEISIIHGTFLPVVEALDMSSRRIIIIHSILTKLIIPRFHFIQQEVVDDLDYCFGVS